MQNYEFMVVLAPEFDAKDEKKAESIVTKLLEGSSATNIKVTMWGKRELAYPIRKKLDGVYVVSTFSSEGVHVGDIEKKVKLEDSVLRYLLLKEKKRKSVS